VRLVKRQAALNCRHKIRFAGIPGKLKRFFTRRQCVIKTPGLRNVAYTAPYMHNGVFSMLSEVMDFYNAGGGKGWGLDVPNQSLDADSLHLTKQEMQNIISFLNALSDTAGLTSRPVSLPRFPNDPGLDERRIGGEY